MPEPIKVFRKGEALSMGHYQLTVRRADNKTTAKILCPRCALPLSLGDHDINASGYVDPGVLCNCGWRSMIKLEGWGA